MAEREPPRRPDGRGHDWSLMVGTPTPAPRRHRFAATWLPWLVGLCAAGIGLGFYQFDNRVKDPAAEGSALKRALNDIELLFIGPGMGVLGYVIMQNLRLREEAHLRLLSEEKRQRFHLLGRVTASMAHEMRNPLQNLHLINDELAVAPPESRSRWIERLGANLDRLDHVVSLAYELSRPGEGGVDLLDLELTAVVESAIRDTLVQFPDAAPPAHERPPGPVPVRGREASLRVAIENLLRNAIEAAPRGPLRVRYLLHRARVTLEISNPGTASRELLNGAETFMSSKPGGIGVGVSIARHLAEHVGGSLAYRNADGIVLACLTLDSPRGGAEIPAP